MFLGRQNKFILAAMLILLVVMTSAAAGSALAKQAEPRGGWQPDPDAYHPNRIIVRFSHAVTANAAVASIQQLGYSVQTIADFKPNPEFPHGVRIGIVYLP